MEEKQAQYMLTQQKCKSRIQHADISFFFTKYAYRKDTPHAYLNHFMRGHQDGKEYSDNVFS
jgi:hypothetical protein